MKAISNTVKRLNERHDSCIILFRNLLNCLCRSGIFKITFEALALGHSNSHSGILKIISGLQRSSPESSRKIWVSYLNSKIPYTLQILSWSCTHNLRFQVTFKKHADYPKHHLPYKLSCRKLFESSSITVIRLVFA